MDKNRKIAFIVVPIAAAVLIAGVLIFYFVFYSKDDNNKKDSSIDYNNPAVIAELNNNQNNTTKFDDISNGEVVDEKTNNELSAKIKDSINSLGDITVNGIKVYKANGITNDSSLNQGATSGQSGNQGYDSGANASGGSGSNSANNQGSNSSYSPDNVNLIMDLTLNPSSGNMETARREMETKANNIAVAIANEKPMIITAIVNFSLKNNPNAKASFIFERNGSNMFLQEFTMSSEFN